MLKPLQWLHEVVMIICIVCMSIMLCNLNQRISLLYIVVYYSYKYSKVEKQETCVNQLFSSLLNLRKTHQSRMPQDVQSRDFIDGKSQLKHAFLSFLK